MNSPIIILKDTLPLEILMNIQKYIVNDVVYSALQEYFGYLYYKKELYEDFVYTQYIMPNCKCIRYYNSLAQRWKTRDCYSCEKYEYSYNYIPKDFVNCVIKNNQYDKIITFKKI